MKLPGVGDLKVSRKRVLLRTNYDVPLTTDDCCVADASRIEESLPTIGYLLQQKASIIVISHLGRPGGKRKKNLSLTPAIAVLSKLLKRKVFLASKVEELKKLRGQIGSLENLRFWPGEEENDSGFAQPLASLADFYINDAFAVSHRQHASIVSLPRLLPSAFGFDFLEEVEVLRQLRENPKRPLVVILGGLKKSKLKIGVRLTKWADWILIGGLAATYVKEIESLKEATKNLIVASRKGEDITSEAIEKFAKLIKRAGTVVWTGPLGLYTDSRYKRGTKEIAELIASSSAYKVVGGGETEAALTKFGLEKKIDYLSSGGGAMLAFLADGTLPGIEAVLKSGKGA